MTLFPWFFVAALAGASTPAATGPTPASTATATMSLDLNLDPNWTPTNQDATRFNSQNQIKMADSGVAVAGVNPEAARAAAFDKQFGPGSYEAAKSFKDVCDPEKGCNRLAAGELITGGNDYANLENDVAAKKFASDSEDFQTQRKKITQEMGDVVQELKPRHGSSSDYDARFIKIADPVVTQIFTKEERAQFAQSVAAVTASGPALTYLGNAQNDAGQPGAARSAFNSALSMNPSNADALTGRAQANYALGDIPAAARDARDALSLNPDDARAYATLKLSEDRAPRSAQGLPAQGDAAAPPAAAGPGIGTSASEPAAAASKTAVPAADARRPDALVAAARQSITLDDSSRAMGLLNRALAADPRNAEAYLLRSMLYTRQGDYRSALSDAEAGLKLRPKDVNLLVAKAFALGRLKDYRAAMAVAQQAREIDPKNADAMAAYAYSAGGLGRRDEMFSLLEQAARRDRRYEASLASARAQPVGSDILFLFPGESSALAAAPAPAPSDAGPPAPARPQRTIWPLLLAAAAAGFLAAVMLLRRQQVRAVFGDAGKGVPTTTKSGPLPALLQGQYRILRRIGSGGMGLVYEGTDVSLDRRIAIKRMREDLRQNPVERRRFVNEAKTVAALHHPNIVDIYGVFDDETDIYLVFEFINGKTVQEILAQRRNLGFKETLGIVRGMTAALDFAHGRNVIHRDLKPSNVMVSEEGFIKVMDFGIARTAKDAISRVSITNTIVGTPPYMSPEQEQGVVRKEGDVFSLAACAYEMLCGKPAYSGKAMLMSKIDMAYIPPSKMCSGLPDGIDEVFARALQPDPDRRYRAPLELLSALESLPSSRAA